MGYERKSLISRGQLHQALLGAIRVIEDATYEETVFLQRVSGASSKLPPRWEDGDILEPMTDAYSDLVLKQEVLDIMCRDEGPGNTERVIDAVRGLIGINISTQEGDMYNG